MVPSFAILHSVGRFVLWRTIYANLRLNRENINHEINGRVQRCGRLLVRARRAVCSFL